VVLDDCWSDGRDENGFLKVDLEKFPSGMNSVSDEIHRQGLLYGMYSSAGEMTCARYGKLRCLERGSKLTSTSWLVGL
jgi:alpha-galactosidase